MKKRKKFISLLLIEHVPLAGGHYVMGVLELFLENHFQEAAEKCGELTSLRKRLSES
jgi:hypothetical protein